MAKSAIVVYSMTAYLCIGLGISLYDNLFGELSAFVWTGSIKECALLLIWWFIVPALIWPWDLFWGVFHRLFHP